MATTVGTPITEQTLKALPQFLDKPVTRMDVVKYTVGMQYEYQADAANAVKARKSEYGNGNNFLFY